MTLGARLKGARLAAGLTQSQVASSTGITQGMLSYLETNRRQPGIENIRRLAKLYNCSVSYLLGHGSESPNAAAMSAGEDWRERILSDDYAPPGLVELARTDVLTEVLGIKSGEWRALRSLDLPAAAGVDGYIQLLSAIRSACHAD